MEETKTKHPDFPEWIKSKAGLSCLEFNTLTDETFLFNRLFWAFDAGRNCVWDQYTEMKTSNASLKEENERLRALFVKVNDLQCHANTFESTSDAYAFLMEQLNQVVADGIIKDPAIRDL
jgi:hypothetical protein